MHEITGLCRQQTDTIAKNIQEMFMRGFWGGINKKYMGIRVVCSCLAIHFGKSAYLTDMDQWLTKFYGCIANIFEGESIFWLLQCCICIVDHLLRQHWCVEVTPVTNENFIHTCHNNAFGETNCNDFFNLHAGIPS